MINNRHDLKRYLAADMRAQGLDRWRLRYRLTQRPTHFQRLLRRSEYWTNTAKTPFGRVIAGYFQLRTKILAERLGYIVPRNVFGPGLSIAHIGPLHVHYRARIGANCRIHQGVSIGEGRPGQFPVIGDDVFIYPGAMVFGVDVGSRVGIRAGSVVTRAVPDDVEVAGVPARIVGSGHYRVDTPPAERPAS